MFQREMANITQDAPDIKVFKDGIGVIGKSIYENHLNQLDEAMTRMKEVDLQINVQKTEWTVKKAICLGFIVSTKKVGSITMKLPKKKICQNVLRRGEFLSKNVEISIKYPDPFN